jgi:hypothetical protein
MDCRTVWARMRRGSLPAPADTPALAARTHIPADHNRLEPESHISYLYAPTAPCVMFWMRADTL